MLDSVANLSLKLPFVMIDFKSFKVCFFIAASFVCSIKAECFINVDGDAPVFSKTLGSKTLILRNGHTDLVLKRGETIRADCPRQISVRTPHNGEELLSNEVKSTVNLKCDQNYRDDWVFYEIGARSQSFTPLTHSSISIKCIQGKRQLYESNSTLPNCESFISYVIGTQSIWRDPIVSASICFDLDNLTVKYIRYQPNRADYEFFTTTERTPTINFDLSSPIEGFDILFKSSATLDSTIEQFKKGNHLLDLHQFNYLSLIQDPTILVELNDFDFMFKIIWWNNLRNGSWKLFFDTLKTRTESGKYDVYTGTSGVLSIPSSSECKQLEEFTVVHEDREVQAPALIWAYLKPMQENNTEEFVIVGHNTPFNSAGNSMQLCKDMCHEVAWLNGSVFNKVHLMPTFGVVECCRTNEVDLKLEGFPIDLSKKTGDVRKSLDLLIP